MSRKYSNPLTKPSQYATAQPHSGPPVSRAAAVRSMAAYDYVIIGAGCAGCVLASRLSEDPDVSVLLLEAGADNTSIFETKVPLLFGKLFHGEHDWNYYTTEQPRLANRRLFWPRGRVLGGSTSLNAMMYHHCSRSDFDEWASEHGCKGWAYDDLAPYMRRMEKFTPNAKRPAIDTKHRGDSGEWQTGYSHLSDIGDQGFLPACEDAGIPLNPDVNTPSGTLGATRFQTFIDGKGCRSSMATAFLSPSVLRRRNLYVACHAHVTKLLFDHVSTDLAAIGAELQDAKGGPQKYQVHAKREVLLCGGSINTPQTLMLSGIGPAEELQKHSIPLLKESDAVGKHLKDHLCPTGIICKPKAGLTLDYLNHPIKALPALLKWFLTGSGPLTNNVGEAAAFIRSVDHKFPGSAMASSTEDYGSGGVGPDLEIIAAPMAFVHHGEELIPQSEGGNAYCLVPIALRPQSAGSVTLQSSNPLDAPIIDPKYLSDENNNDWKVLVNGFRVCQKIIQSPALQKYLEPVPTNDDPTSYWWPYSASNIDDISDETLVRYMKEKAFTLYHPVGTARMGTSPETSVVDLQCRVHGVQGLRVMDASVFPEQVSGHPTAPLAAMAYKLSDEIRDGRKREAASDGS